MDHVVNINKIMLGNCYLSLHRRMHTEITMMLYLGLDEDELGNIDEVAFYSLFDFIYKRHRRSNYAPIYIERENNDILLVVTYGDYDYISAKDMENVSKRVERYVKNILEAYTNENTKSDSQSSEEV